MTEITQKLLHKLFDYREDGHLIWKNPTSRRMLVGDIAGCPDSNGYWRIRVDGKRPRLHRLIWLYHYGCFPTVIDHINRNKSDSRIENLREVTRQQNGQNRDLQKNSTSGYKGVTWNAKSKKWVARINITKKRKCLGYFKYKKHAAIAYNKAATEHFGDFSVLNKIRK